MSARSERLATRFDQACHEFNALVDGLSEAEWRKVTTAERWSVGVVVHHVAEGHMRVVGLIQSIAMGEPVAPITRDTIDEDNARLARVAAGASKATALPLLQANGVKAREIIRGLSDAELDRSAIVLAGVPPMTAAQAVEGMINHIHEHLGSIRTAITRW